MSHIEKRLSALEQGITPLNLPPIVYTCDSLRRAKIIASPGFTRPETLAQVRAELVAEGYEVVGEMQRAAAAIGAHLDARQ